MAETINLVCKDCNEYIWIGQVPSWGREAAYIYYAPDKQARFCLLHKNHNLTLADSNWHKLGDCKEFEPDYA